MPEDTTTGRGASWCAVRARRDPPPDGCDPDGRDDDRTRATLLDAPRETRICDDDVDWYRVVGDGRTRVRIAFRHADGDLDLEAADPTGARIALSNSITDEEVVEGSAPFFVRVYGYAGATNTYVISATPLE